MDYSFFDGLIDSVFVIKNDKSIIYCNEPAAALCDSSVRRLTRGKPIFDFITFEEKQLFVMPEGTLGLDSPHPYSEMKYLLKTGKEGKVQVAIQPFVEPSGDKCWVVIVRDVTIEEVLHAKHHKQLAELEKYSKNLEQMVEERTIEVKKAYKMLNAIMNSLGQGFFVFDKNGECSDYYTRACIDILEVEPAKKKVWEVLKIDGTEMKTFDMWMSAIYSEKLPFDSLKELGPSLFAHTKDKHVRLEYFPLRDEDTKISNIVVVATDKTNEYMANLALEKEKKFAGMVVKLITSKRQFARFLEGVEGVINDIKEKAQLLNQDFDHEYVFRMLHTLEGEAATHSVGVVWADARRCQELIEPVKSGLELFDIKKQQALFVLLNELLNNFNNFKVENAQLFAMVGIGGAEKVEITITAIEKMLQNLMTKGVSKEICDEFENEFLREPIVDSFRHFQDVVKVVADKTGKKINPLTFTNGQIKIFPDLYKDLLSAFVHIFRNAVDHGIEAPEEREMMGKSTAGSIKVEFSINKKNHPCMITIAISDDGGGISVDRIRSKISESQIYHNANQMSDAEVLQLIFESGLSTKSEVGEFSGRGIGLNAVKFEAEKLGGSVKVESVYGKGSVITVQIPDLSRIAQVEKVA